MDYLSQIIFGVVFLAALSFFIYNVRRIRNNIRLGKNINRSDHKKERWRVMFRVALGQSKMKARPLAGFLHLIVYVGFLVVNIELLEIVVDGLSGSERSLGHWLMRWNLGPVYDFLIATFEIFALLVLVACVLFLLRRNVAKIRRFHLSEMTRWPKSDANLILIFEIVLMAAFLLMDAADYSLYANSNGADAPGMYPVSALLHPLFAGSDVFTLQTISHVCWWIHIVGIFVFLNYIPFSKHFHIILAFPNTFFSNLWPKGRFTNMENVKKEVELMFDPNADPYATPAPAEEGTEPGSFGAKDVTDLTWKQLLDAYTCTECGRCSSECPANLTGKLLSPRKIMMDTRDRLEEVGRNKRKNGANHDDGKSLLHHHITKEELWACTSCNACTQACPVNIDPLSIIVDLRRYLVMEESQAPPELTVMFNNIENNGAPWAFPQADRFKWAEDD